ncbi:MAG: glycosyltransferase family 39 protein [Candidatus Omnitrophica bacterium]|nr:glycosyltransferase family 39 protein [Candidatus Omnitrophota bacterium]
MNIFCQRIFKNISGIHKVIFVLVLIALLVRIPLSLIRYFDPDEFEHLHAARNIYHGMVPYKDYFDHHTPFFHAFLSAFYIFLADKIQLIFLARFFMILFTGGILYMTYRIAKLLYGVNIALYSVVFLSYVVMFQEKTLEIRTDLPAVIFLLLSIYLFMLGMQDQDKHERKRQRDHFLMSGVTISCALLTNQKMFFAIFALLLMWIWVLFNGHRKLSLKEWSGPILWFIFGFFIPFGITCLYFSLSNALKEFIYRCFVMNILWKTRFLPYQYVGQLIIQNPFFSVLSALGLLFSTFAVFKKKKIPDYYFVPVFVTYAFIIGLFIIRVPQRQYYLFFIPLLAVYCGFAFQTFIGYFSFHNIKEQWNKQNYLYFGLMPVFLIIVLLIPSMVTSIRIYGVFSTPDNKPYLIYVLLGLVSVLFLSGFAFFRGKKQFFALMLMVCFLYLPFIETCTEFLKKDWRLKCSNVDQLDEIRFILRNTNPQDTIFDGFRGTGVFRNQAYYYFFLHAEIQKMLTPRESSTDIVAALRNMKPKFVIYDWCVGSLPGEVRAYINDNYTPVRKGEIYLSSDETTVVEWRKFRRPILFRLNPRPAQ